MSAKKIPLSGRSLFFVILIFLIQFSSLQTFGQFTKLFDFGSESGGHAPYGSPVSDGTFLYGVASSGGVNNSGTIYKIKPDGTGFVKLYNFNDGRRPYGALFYDGTYFYGTTSEGGASDHGTIFKIKSDGTGFSKLLDFDYTTNGAFPYGSLIFDGTFLYGTTSQGGSGNYGTVFKIKPDGTGFANVVNFDGSGNGGYPWSSLYSDGTFLYGTTSGGFSFNGNIFKVKPDGTGFVKLHDFVNSDGANPNGALISDGTFLYGTTLNGGSVGNGTIFKIMPDGSGFTTIVNFTNTVAISGGPRGTLAYDGTFLYGTTTSYGANSRGAIFKVQTDGSNFTKLFNNVVSTNGPIPEGTLLMIGTTLYGVRSGGVSGSAPFLPGTIFKINTDGTSYTSLHTFETEGSYPKGSLAFDGTYLYGVTSDGGLYDEGTLFRVNPDGTGYLRLLDFTGANGQNPVGRLISDGTYLYGMTYSGGVNDDGVIYRIKPDGTGYLKLLDFDYTNNGNSPNGSLIYDGTYLYGMTSNGGANSAGTIFKILPDGTGYTKLYDLNDTDGSYPDGSLLGISGFLYGMTNSGGTNGSGTLFKIKTDGTGFSKLYDFGNTDDGSEPEGSLFYDGSFLYGMTPRGGLNLYGTIFKIKPDGSSYQKLLDFDNANTGERPYGSLVSVDGTTFYGMTESGGKLGKGVIFSIRNDGTNFTKLYDFNDGENPRGSLISVSGFLYGMAENGGANYGGILFKCSMTPFVSISDFSPAEGVVGSTVTILGTAFDPSPANNTVKFNGTTATVTSSTANTIKAVVPTGASSGPISVTVAGVTATSISDFTVSTYAVMNDGQVIKSCNLTFLSPVSSNDAVETFVPVNAGDKIKVSFQSFSVFDLLNVYDGPSTASPRIASLQGSGLPPDIVATGPGGELTFQYIFLDESVGWSATISCVSSGISIQTVPLTGQSGGKITLNLVPLITTLNNNLDLTSLQVVSAPSSGASATISSDGVLTIDYNARQFTGTEQITIKACDTNGNCTTQTFDISIAAATDLVVYNGISPNGVNPSFIIQNIDVLPDTKSNTVYIFDRWENQVWHGSNYDNNAVVFTGVSDNGSDLPSGVYYYRIDFASGRKKLTGFLSLRRH